MKTLIIMAVLAVASTSFADVYVNGYMKSSGTYVQPYVRSSPDAYQENNYGYKYNGGLR